MGDLEFGYESFDLTSEPGLTMLVYTIEPHSPTAERMALLGSWTTTPATVDEAETDPSRQVAPRDPS